MNVSRRGRSIHWALAAGLSLAGCGASQLPIVSPEPAAQSSQTVMRSEHDAAWMSPAAKNENLVYLSAYAARIDVYTFPKGEQVGSIPDRGYPQGLCSDLAGNVFVVDTIGDRVQEYAHGALKREALLKDPMKQPVSCSVDANGNLAVLNLPSPIAVEVFSAEEGKPRAYVVPKMSYPRGIAYDGQGDLFVDGSAHDGRIELVELPAGASKFVELAVEKRIVKHIGDGPMQWDGAKLAVEEGDRIDRLTINGTTATLHGRVSLGEAQGLNQ